MKPTDQQQAAADAFLKHRLLKITAFAGAGKTTTLQLLANSRKERGLYIAFNKQIQLHASKHFPKDRVECRTVHSLAYRAVRAKRNYSADKMQGRMSSAALARELKLGNYKISTTHRLSPIQHAHLLARTVTRYCQSSDDTITPDHVPHYRRLDELPPCLIAPTKAYAAENAQKLWERMTTKDDPIPLGHDGYLKLWSLDRPLLDYGYILLDEAQDTNPTMLSVLNAQDRPLALVGDKHQSIYEFRQAINAMATMHGATETYLTQSFRFGEDLAAEATKVLRALGEPRTLRGLPQIETAINPEIASGIDCILARTNASVMTEIIAALQAEQKPHILGGTAEIKRLLADVTHLKNGRAALSPELFGFDDWDQVREFAGTEEGEDLSAFVSLVAQHGEEALTEALNKTASHPDKAKLTIGTAHKAKGCEWNSVRLSGDFLTQRVIKRTKSAPPDIRLFYVAMTRAKTTLTVDPEILSTFTRERPAPVYDQDPARPRDPAPSETPSQPAGQTLSPFLLSIFNRSAQRKNEQRSPKKGEHSPSRERRGSD